MEDLLFGYLERVGENSFSLWLEERSTLELCSSREERLSGECWYTECLWDELDNDDLDNDEFDKFDVYDNDELDNDELDKLDERDKFDELVGDRW